MKNGFLLLVAATVSTACGGGFSKDVHYRQAKKFGQPDAPIPTTNEEGNEEEVVVATPPPTETSTRAPAETTPEVKEPAIEPEIEGGETTPPVVEVNIDPKTIVAAAKFKGGVDWSSMRLMLADGSTYDPRESSILSSLLPDPNVFKADAKLWSYQTYGDEKTGVSVVTQHAISNSADFVVAVGEESESGTQVLERVVGDEACPASMVCIRKTLWKPALGAKRTYCYRDLHSKKLTLLPLAPAPNFSRQDFEKIRGSYGPFTVETYLGDVNCAKPRAAVQQTQNVYVRVNVAPAESMTYRIRTKDLAKPSFVVRVIVDKYGRESGANLHPYVDMTTRLQENTEYYISEERKSYVKIIKKMRKNLRFAGDETWIGSVIRSYNSVSSVMGMMVDVHVEHCEGLIGSERGKVYCPSEE
jgi:hypothetical protein